MEPKLWKKGKSAGYDSTARRYRSISGDIISKREYRQLTADPTVGEDPKFQTQAFFPTPMSDAFSSMEAMIGGLEQDVHRINVRRDGSVEEGNLVEAAEKLERIIKYVSPKDQQPAEPIPGPVMGMMRMSDFYTNTEGDIWQHITAPIDVAVNRPDIQEPDKGIKETLEEIYDRLDMKHIMSQIWMSAARYGAAYPMVVFDKPLRDGRVQKGSQLLGIVMLPPKFVWVGYYVHSGLAITYGSPSPYGLNPLSDTEPKWTDKLVESTMMPMNYNSFSQGWNDQIINGQSIPLDPKLLRPIRSRSMDWEKYPYPDLPRAYRQISTRFIFEEVVRATVEGHKSQLWLFKLLKDGDLVPTRADLSLLNSVVGAGAGKRTGHMTWRGNLVVEQHTPKPLDQMLGNESWQQFTLRIYRQLGGSARLVTGNGFMGDRGDAGVDIDLSIWLKRMDYYRDEIMSWERHLRELLAEADGGEAWQKSLRTTKVRFARSLLENSDLIKKELNPLYMGGVLSRTTMLTRAGYSYEQEKANKKTEEPDAEMFGPPATYNQIATDKEGNTKSSKTAPRGRPADNVNPNKIKAAVEDETDRKVLFAAILAAYLLLLEDGDIDIFITAMSTHMYLHLPEIAQAGYESAGGVGTIDDRWKTSAADFVTAFLDGLRRDMKVEGADLSKFERRVMLYPNDGSRMAFVHGVQAAMEMRGATFWQRILHPEKSLAGPCPHCVADSMLIHGIEERFTQLHPGCQCEHQELFVQFFAGEGIPSVEMPVPGYSEDQFKALLDTLGKQGKPVIRRVRR